MNLDALVTPREAEELPALRAHHVTRHRISQWVGQGRIPVRGRRGRAPLLRFGDILRTERDTRLSGVSHRGPRQVEEDVVPAA